MEVTQPQINNDSNNLKKSTIPTSIPQNRTTTTTIENNEIARKIFMEKCFKRVIGHLDFLDRLQLETVNSDWRDEIYYDDIKSFRLSDLTSWSDENALSRWRYDLQSGYGSEKEGWSTLEGNALHRILNCVLSRCKNLVSLSFSDGLCRHGNGENVKIVVTVDTTRILKCLSPQIQYLDLSNCAITDDALLKLMKKYKRTLMELNLSECTLLSTGILSIPQLVRSLDDGLRKMRSLRRLNPSIQDFDALTLPETGLQCFTCLELTNKTISADDQLSRLWCEGGHSCVYNLEGLVLADNNSMRRFDVISHLQSLRRLVLQRLPRLSDDDLQQIFHWCQKLVHVELVDCRRVRFRFRWPEGLRRLSIVDPSVFDCENLVSIGAQSTNLRKFELRMKNLHTNGPDANAYALFAKLCTRLRKVSIDVVTVPSSILFQFVLHCKNLTTFRCKQMTVDEFATGQAELGAISGRKTLRLKRLYLYNMDIDFHLFMELIDRCHRLAALRLHHISFSSVSRDDSFSAFLWTLANRCLRLQCLVIADCGEASPKSIRSFHEARQKQMEGNCAVGMKRTKFHYRNSVKRLLESEDAFANEMRMVGVDFEQERGVEYIQRHRTSFGDTPENIAFC